MNKIKIKLNSALMKRIMICKNVFFFFDYKLLCLTGMTGIVTPANVCLYYCTFKDDNEKKQGVDTPMHEEGLKLFETHDDCDGQWSPSECKKIYEYLDFVEY